MPELSPATLLGLATGGGVLLMWYGIQRLRDRALPPERRRQGWWGVHLGLLLVVGSMVLFVRT